MVSGVVAFGKESATVVFGQTWRYLASLPRAAAVGYRGSLRFCSAHIGQARLTPRYRHAKRPDLRKKAIQQLWIDQFVLLQQFSQACFRNEDRRE
jgi:hypothetical protein